MDIASHSPGASDGGPLSLHGLVRVRLKRRNGEWRVDVFTVDVIQNKTDKYRSVWLTEDQLTPYARALVGEPRERALFPRKP